MVSGEILFGAGEKRGKKIGNGRLHSLSHKKIGKLQ